MRVTTSFVSLAAVVAHGLPSSIGQTASINVQRSPDFKPDGAQAVRKTYAEYGIRNDHLKKNPETVRQFKTIESETNHPDKTIAGVDGE